MSSPSAVFVDASGWIALLNRDDRHRLIATQVMETLAYEKRLLITTDWVFAETGNSLARTSSRLAIVAAVATFAQNPQSKLTRVHAALWEQALDLYAQAKDKTWGLVDCASFVVVREEGITDALTSDRHFQQAGFRSLQVTNRPILKLRPALPGAQFPGIPGRLPGDSSQDPTA